ncbi:hypothetical protein [Lactobacillus sp.]|uniref:hypothetical protein n=1 Tax=Lactobacillus sp. TaxID=1591 RepID=UPI0019B41765|nr:hypothetical protein [Lactobacillus sp.]MBD5429320.1 hypothetical protein [Lactobacillus sp.]
MNFNYEKKTVPNLGKTKVKMFFFYCSTDKRIEDKVNEFIEDKDVIDIKFTTDNYRKVFTVMVIYNA